MPGLRVTAQCAIPARELRVTFSRSGGPGGQNVNKVETKVQLRWNPAGSAALSDADRAWLLRRLGDKLTADGDLLVTSNRTRDQARNREDAEDKLAEMLRAALRRPKRRRATRPSQAALQRRIDEKKARSRLKQARRRDDE
jgi:ribosome-associated protein